jgi:hypothetical protein
MHPDPRDRMRQARAFEDINSDIPVFIVTMKRFYTIFGEATTRIQCHASTSTSHTEGPMPASSSQPTPLCTGAASSNLSEGSRRPRSTRLPSSVCESMQAAPHLSLLVRGTF